MVASIDLNISSCSPLWSTVTVLTVLRDLTRCSLVHTACCCLVFSLLHWRWMEHVSPKCWYPLSQWWVTFWVRGPCLSFLSVTSFYLLMVAVGVILARDRTQWHTHTLGRTSGRGIGLSQTPDNTPHPGGIRTRSPSKRAAADPRLRPDSARAKPREKNSLGYIIDNNLYIFTYVLLMMIPCR
jgi:hypothetical protein